MLLRSFKDLKTKLNVKLFLIGYGREEKNIRSFIKKHNLKDKIKIIKILIMYMIIIGSQIYLF